VERRRDSEGDMMGDLDTDILEKAFDPNQPNCHGACKRRVGEVLEG